MLIGLTGLKGAGKDTVAAFLVKQHGFERRAFADPLKKSVASLFDIPFHLVDKYKNDPNIAVTLHYVDDTHPQSTTEKGTTMTFREFLQRYGTEAHRDVPEMGYDFWVELLLPVRGYYAERNIVISDVRFDNEAKRITLLDGINVEVSRATAVSKDPHRSEDGIDPDLVDYTIFNNGSLDELGSGVDVMIEHYSQYVG